MYLTQLNYTLRHNSTYHLAVINPETNTTSDIHYVIILRTAATNYKLNKNKLPKYKTNLNVTKLENR